MARLSRPAFESPSPPHRLPPGDPGRLSPRVARWPLRARGTRAAGGSEAHPGGDGERWRRGAGARRPKEESGPGSEWRWDPGEGLWNGGGSWRAQYTAPGALGVLTCDGSPRTALRLGSTPAGPAPLRREAWRGPGAATARGQGRDFCTCLGRGRQPEAPALASRVPAPPGRPASRASAARQGWGDAPSNRVLAARAPSTPPPGGGAAHCQPSAAPACLHYFPEGSVLSFVSISIHLFISVAISILMRSRHAH